MRTEPGPGHLLATCTAAGTAVLLVWVIGAVGLIGAEGDPFDRIYFGVLGVAVVGAAAARLRPPGMARAMVVTAIAQAAVAVVALVVGKQHAEVSSVGEIVGANGVFVALWAGAGWLFRRAARR